MEKFHIVEDAIQKAAIRNFSVEGKDPTGDFLITLARTTSKGAPDPNIAELVIMTVYICCNLHGQTINQVLTEQQKSSCLLLYMSEPR